MLVLTIDAKYFCDGSKCKVQYYGLSLYKDASHLSNFGTKADTANISGFENINN